MEVVSYTKSVNLELLGKVNEWSGDGDYTFWIL